MSSGTCASPSSRRTANVTKKGEREATAPARRGTLLYSRWPIRLDDRTGPPYRRTPRRPCEVGEKPTRSRHCKRGALSHRPRPSIRRTVTGLRVWEDRECAAIRKSGNLASGALFLFGARDAARRIHGSVPDQAAG